MKKLTAILMILATLFTCAFVTGCGCSRVKPKLNTNALDRIKVYESGVNGEKGKNLVTLKGASSQAMGDLSQLYAEVKSTKEKPKEDTSKATKAYLLEILNYTDEGKAKDSNFVNIYYIGDRVYCYYPGEQSFGDGDFYLNGYTNVKQENFENMAKGGK